MLIAILSDTHDDMPRLLRALELIENYAPAALIHCGDLCGSHMLAPLAHRNAYFVFGNNDFEIEELRAEALRLNINCLGHDAIITLAGKTVGVTHGHDIQARNRMLAAGVDYLFSGHTHVPHDIRRGPTRLINPGALHRAVQKTFAILDLATDTLDVHQVP